MNPRITDEQRARLFANGEARAAGHATDLLPVVRLFTPDAHATWLLASLDPADGDTAVRPVPLDWQDASDPNPSDQVTYDAYVSPSQQFLPESTLVVGDLTSSHSLAWPEWDGLTYWWKVRAQDSWGQITWSNQTFSFRLENYGDVNNDGSIDVEDAVFILNYVLRGGPSPEPLASGDVNGDCQVDLGVVVYLLNYLFKGGSNPVLGCA